MRGEGAAQGFHQAAHACESMDGVEVDIDHCIGTMMLSG